MAASAIVVWTTAGMSAQDAGGRPWPPMACAPDVHALLAEWQATGERYPDAPGPLGGDRWRLATARVGTWIVLDLDAGRPTVSQIGPHATHHVSFGSSCEASRRSAAGPPPPAGAFDDDDVAALVAEGRPGVIYVWSPHMPLSVDGYAQIVQACQALGIGLTVLLDPGADGDYARAVARSAGLPDSALRPFHSVELAFRNATLHAPSVLVHRTGRVIGPAVPGYRDAHGYRAVIEARVEARPF